MHTIIIILGSSFFITFFYLFFKIYMIYIDIMVIKENRKHNGFLNEWINSGFNFNIEDRLHFTPLSFFLNSIDPKEFNNYSDEIKSLFYKKHNLEKILWGLFLFIIILGFISDKFLN